MLCWLISTKRGPQVTRELRSLLSLPLQIEKQSIIHHLWILPSWQHTPPYLKLHHLPHHHPNLLQLSPPDKKYLKNLRRATVQCTMWAWLLSYIDQINLVFFVGVRACFVETICRILKANLSWSPNWAKFCQFIANFLLLSIKDTTQNRPLLLTCQQNDSIGPIPLSVQTHHKFRKVQSFWTKKCGVRGWKTLLARKMFALDNPSDCRRLLWTAPT